MGLLIVSAIGVAVIGYYFLNRQAVSLSPGGSFVPNINLNRVQGSAPGTIPAGVSLPGQSAEGPGPNTTAALVSTGGAAGIGLAGMAATTAGITALGAATVGVGVVIGVGLALWQAHLARVKGAKDENAVLNELVPNFSVALQKEFGALNSGQVSPTTALQDLEAIRSTYWQAIAPYQKGPGQHTHPCAPLLQSDALNTGEYAPGCIPWKSATIQTTPCDNSCTAGCCIGCDAVEPAICAAKYIIQQGGGSVKMHAIAGSKYGYAGQPSYTLTYTPPAGSSGYGLF